MLTFKEYFNYYEDLDEYNNSNIPSDYSDLGSWGELHWKHLIAEGLITSYPKKKVIDFIEHKGWKVIQKDTKIPFQSEKTPPIIATILKTAIDDSYSYTLKLNKELFVYGYIIGSYMLAMDGGVPVHRISIEPKYTELVNPKIMKKPFYHITHKQYVDKIKKIGLTPRNSTTVFSHPGNRIYLIQANTQGILDQIKSVLSRSKKERMSSNTNIPEEVLDNWKDENMVVFQVNVEGLKLYEDPMFPSTTGKFTACFTTQNISPDKLTLTGY